MRRIVGVGRPTVDRLIAVPHTPSFGAGMIVRSLGIFGGGPVATALVAARRLGWETALIARVGEDETGQEIIRGLATDGVDTELIAVDPAARGATSTILVDPAGARSILHDPGGQTDPVIAAEIEAAIRSSAGLMLERRTDAAMSAARIARDAGIPVLLDAGGHDADILDLVALATIVIASTYHAQKRRLTPEAAARELHDLGVETAIVTLGEDGAIAIAGNTTHHQPAFPVDVVDTTGAGDIYHGAFFVAYLEGMPLPESMRFAAMAAALKCRQHGGRAGIPTRAELDRAISSPPDPAGSGRGSRARRRRSD
ncbi:MAG: carbohydrate kinase family protein [Thermomicrobiales bacterium]